MSPDLIIERILADGYFVAANAVSYLQSQRIQFLFNMKEYTSVKEHIEDFKEKQLQMALDAGVDTKNPRKLYRWLKKQQYLSIATSIAFDSKPDIPVSLCIVCVLVKKKQKDATYVYYRDYYSYCSNISENGECLLKLYKIRWGIETQYRVVHQFQGYTTCAHALPRIMLFGLGFVILCLWLWYNFFQNRIRDGTMIHPNLKSYIPIYKQDIIILIGKKFVRAMLKILRKILRI